MADRRGGCIVKIPEDNRRVLKVDSSNGKILKEYGSLKELADENEISSATAYYKVRYSKPYNGEMLIYEDEWEKRFPMLAKAREVTEVSDEQADNEWELISQSVAQEKDTVKTKNDTKNDTSDTKNDTKDTKGDMVNHPSHYCTGEVECWDAMMSAFGAEWMKIYANVAMFKYSWRAKHKGKFTEDMKKAVWYGNKAAELEELING
jgi:hypothetical protein